MLTLSHGGSVWVAGKVSLTSRTACGNRVTSVRDSPAVMSRVHLAMSQRTHRLRVLTQDGGWMSNCS